MFLKPGDQPAPDIEQKGIVAWAGCQPSPPMRSVVCRQSTKGSLDLSRNSSVKAGQQ
jgi:hypothetical protein